MWSVYSELLFVTLCINLKFIFSDAAICCNKVMKRINLFWMIVNFSKKSEAFNAEWEYFHIQMKEVKIPFLGRRLAYCTSGHMDDLISENDREF